MSTSRRRRQRATRARAAGGATQTLAREGGASARSSQAQPPVRPFIAPPVRGVQSLLWPLFAALAFWALAASFYFFLNDPDHILYAFMAVLVALLWSFSFSVRLRRLLQQKSRA
jgi:hypothetical protein